jgi:PadR family transcriptional regulator PadR
VDIQLKRGFLDVCVLTVLSKEDSYGYKIIKDLSENIEISESTLYPILKRLENSDCLTVYSVEHNSRLRKYYKITLSGRQRIVDFLEEWKTVMDIYEFIKGEVTYE